MSRNLPRIFSIDIRNAELQGGIRDLIANWSQKPGEEASIQAQWQVIVERLRNDRLLEAFRADTGIAENTTNPWMYGNDLPTPKMCILYMNLVVEKIDEEIQRVAERRQKLLEPPKKRSAKVTETEEFPLPDSVILSFSLPELLDGKATVTGMHGYLDLSTRLRDCLKNGNAVHAEDLAYHPTSESWQKYRLRTPNFGRKSLGELYHFMVKNDFIPKLAGSNE